MSEKEQKLQEQVYPQLLLDTQLCFPLYAASRKVVNAYGPLLKPLGLTYTQYIVLLALWEKGKTSVGDLGRRLYLDCGTLTPLLKKMEESGWIDRCRCREDERMVYVSVTDRGWELREQVKDIPMQMGTCITLPQQDALDLYRLLHRLLDAMEGN
ncbi:MAG: MarR family transcriptional regulator [Clostridia bacterium]|nr:MarR family transcriptional regulator [Clostridia bacterium]